MTEKIKQEKNTEIEQKEEKPLPEKLSIAQVDESLADNIEAYDNLNSFYKTEVFKGVDFQDKRVAIDNLNDKFDESAYAKTGFFQKFDNFTRFGLHKKHYGLLKSKERGLLDKTEINENIDGKNIDIGQDNKKEREYLESNVIDINGDFKKDSSERTIIKRFEKIDSKIVKVIESKRTEKGEIEAAVNLKNKKIKEADNLGADIIKSKEQFEKHLSDKGKLDNLKYLSVDGKEDLRRKMAEEEVNFGNLIKDKEAELTDKLSIFKEPLEERHKQTSELLDKVSLVFESAKDVEQDFKEKVREIDNEIKLIENSGILAESKKSIINELKLNREESTRIFNVAVELRTNMEARLKVLTVNKKELTDELSKINKIGKTKKEIEEEKTEKDKTNKKTGKNILEQFAEEEKDKITKKSGGTDFAEDWSFMEGQKIGKEAKNEQTDNEGNILYDLTDKEDKVSIDEIIGSYLVKKAPQNKKDKGWFDGFIKNVFISLFELKKINVPINRKRVLKETDIIFKKSQKKESKQT